MSPDVTRPPMMPGESYCLTCDVWRWKDMPYQGEGHIAGRFWEDGTLPFNPANAYLDDAFVPRCLEAMAGREGWLIHEIVDAHCTRCGSPMAALRTGHVHVVPLWMEDAT